MNGLAVVSPLPFYGKPPLTRPLDKNQEYRRLAMGPLLHDLQQKLAKKAALGSKDPSRILIHSTHDTSLAGINSALDVFDNRWPAFTASITFELFKESLQPKQGFLAGLRQTVLPSERPRYYVRMRYQNKDMAIPYCKLEGNHLPGAPEFCTLKAFQERIRELTPEDWDAECVPQGRNTTTS
jgi:acid phosphatase